MDASKVTFTERTLAQLQNPVIKQGKKRQLRRELVMEFIRSKPAGTKLRANQLANAAGIMKGSGSYRNFTRFLHDMERDKLITIEQIPNSWKSIYTVSADAKTAISTPRPVQQAAPKTETEKPAIKTLGEYAREYAWKNNSDSLRGFVSYMDGIELDLRRQIQGGGY